jgi:signal transduction histidine kinase
VVGATLQRFVESGIEREDAARLIALHAEAIAGAAGRSVLDALDAADAEDALLARLDALGVPEPWRLAEPLAGAGVDVAWIDRVAAVAGPATDAALAWVAATLTARSLAGELQEATRRMSSLVGAVKSYAYMDRGEVVEVDIHEGLETTLTVLGHRLKHTAITVVREYDRTLPKVTVRGSELNQVWTNLLENAIDALGESGTITITTRHADENAEIDIADDGPGIPADVLEHVFDSFFTTKDVGHGTGLGLATAHRIVADRHDGSLSVESRPGRTVFSVQIPLQATRGSDQ